MMKRQVGFAEAEIAGKKRVTRRQRFLPEMEKVVPWQRLLLAIKPYYPKGTRGALRLASSDAANLRPETVVRTCGQRA